MSTKRTRIDSEYPPGSPAKQHKKDKEKTEYLTHEEAEDIQKQLHNMYKDIDKDKEGVSGLVKTGARATVMKEKVDAIVNKATLEAKDTTGKPINIFFCGPAGAGKSTLINEIAKSNIVVAGASSNSLTKIATCISHGDWSLSVTIFKISPGSLLEGDKLPHDYTWETTEEKLKILGNGEAEGIKETMQKTKEKQNSILDIAYFDVRMPSIAPGYKFWDTPGSDDTNKVVVCVREWLIAEYADVIALVLPTTRMEQKIAPAMEGLAARITKKRLPQVIVVANYQAKLDANVEDRILVANNNINNSSNNNNNNNNSSSSDIEYKDGKTYVVECLGKYFENPHNFATITGQARHIFVEELNRHLKYIPWWNASGDIVERLFAPHFENMAEVRMNYYLWELLPTANTFCIRVKRTLAMEKAFKPQNIPDDNVKEAKRIVDLVFNSHIWNMSDADYKLSDFLTYYPRNLDAWINALFADLMRECSVACNSVLCLAIEVLLQNHLPEWLKETETIEGVFDVAQRQFETKLDAIKYNDLDHEESQNEHVVQSSATLQDNREQFNTYVQALVQKELLRAINAVGKKYKALFQQKTRTQRFIREIDVMLEQVMAPNSTLHIEEKFSEIVANEFSKCKDQREKIQRKQSETLRKFVDDIKANLSNAAVRKHLGLANKISLDKQIREVAKRIHHPKFKTVANDLVTLAGAEKVMIKLLDPTRHVPEVPSMEDAINQLELRNLSDEAKKKAKVAVFRSYAKAEIELPVAKLPKDICYNCKFSIHFANSTTSSVEDKAATPVYVRFLSDTPLAIEIKISGESTDKQQGDKFEVTINEEVLKSLHPLLVALSKEDNERKNSAKQEGPNYLYPIFMPSKQRAGIQVPYSKRSGVYCHIPVFVENNNNNNNNTGRHLEQNSHTVLFLLIEDNEVEAYRKLSLPQHANQRVFLVSIPGTDRGVGFARQMILLLYEALAAKLLHESSPISFPYFYMLDDDLVEVRVHDKDLFQMRPCTLSFALKYMQRVMDMEVSSADRRMEFLEALSGKEGDLSESEKDQLDYIEQLVADLVKKISGIDRSIRTKKLFLESYAAILQSHNFGEDYFLKENASVPLFREIGGHKSEDARKILAEFKKALFDQLEGIRQKTRFSIALVSIPKPLLPGRPDPNFIPPPATHKVSSTHHALTLVHGPAVRGLGYLSNITAEHTALTEKDLKQLTVAKLVAMLKEQYHVVAVGDKKKDALIKRILGLEKLGNDVNNLLTPQAVVLERSKNPNIISKAQFGFLSEDKRYAINLFRNGKGGFSVYLFDAKWGDQQVGGCFNVRQHLPSNQRFGLE